MNKFLHVGLGNVGNEYAHTRHNIGFDVVYAFVSKHGGIFTNERLAFKADIKWKGKTFICICPTTYMNLSGKAFRYWLEKENIPIENSLTIVDELALPLNKIRLKRAGSSGGHNGLKDIEAVMNTTAYPRLRFGIGNDYPKGMQAEFVLGKWRKEEEPMVKLKVDKCTEIIEQFATIGIDKAMTFANSLDFTV